MKIKYVEKVPTEVGGIWLLQNIVFIYSMFLGMENILRLPIKSKNTIVVFIESKNCSLV